MSKKAYLFSSICIVFLLLQCGSEKQDGSQNGVPGARARAALNDGQLTISVKIPHGFHAYLDSGPGDNLLPVQFNWQQIQKEGIITMPPVTTQKPVGVRDSESGAMVLRGDGQYVFENMPGAVLGESIGMRIQLCDDTLGICHRPTTSQIKIEKGPLAY